MPTMVQLERLKWPVCEMGEDQTDQVIAYTQKCVVVPLDTRIALLAAELHRQHKLTLADAIVYATAREQCVDLLTCRAFRRCWRYRSAWQSAPRFGRRWRRRGW